MTDPAQPAWLVTSSLQGTVISVEVGVGDAVAPGTVVALVESMKLHHEVRAEHAGVVLSLDVAVGATVHSGDVLLAIGASDSLADTSVAGVPAPPHGTARPRPARSRRRHRSAPTGTRQRPSRRRSTSPRQRSPNSPRERRRPARRRVLRGIRSDHHRCPVEASPAPRSDHPHAGRRNDRRDRHDQR